MLVLGIDIGGSGVKGAPVDTETGTLVQARLRIPTPMPPTPDALATVVSTIVQHFSWPGVIGCAFPGVIKAGHTLTAANLDPAWVGIDADDLLSAASGRAVTLMNDADAAGFAELRFGAAAGRSGVVLLLTLGTGIGSALLHDGRLIPNTELGHLELRGKPAEKRAAARVRDEKKLSWAQYAKRVNEYLALVERALWPDLIIIGGGVSAKAERWFHLLESRAPLVPAALFNDAGIVGAALWARYRPDPQPSISAL